MDLSLTDLITLFWTLFQMYERFLKKPSTKSKSKKRKKKPIRKK